MQRYFFHLAYDGSFYRGWQRQPKVRSVQETIETCLSQMFKEDITLYGCGRTDALVHAKQYYAHINLSQPIDFDVAFVLNKILPDSIGIYRVFEVPNDLHARFSAQERTYQYSMHHHPNPFLSRYSTHDNLQELDIVEMHKACKAIERIKDFKLLCKTPEKHNHTLCEVESCNIEYDAKTMELKFTIKANRFLRGMIRILVARLIQIGRNEITLSEFLQHVQEEIPFSAFECAYPQGLSLIDIDYPSKFQQYLQAPGVFNEE